jgi:hypothetical protein
MPITAFAAEHDPARWPAYAEAGIERIVLSLESATSEAVLPQLDHWAEAIAKLA